MAAVGQVSRREAWANLEAVRRLFAALITGDLTRADEFVAPTYGDGEGRKRGDLSSPLRGVAGFRESAGRLRGAFSDLIFEEREVIAAGDRVVVHGQEVDIGQVVAQVRDSDAHGTIMDFNDPRGDRIEVSVE